MIIGSGLEVVGLSIDGDSSVEGSIYHDGVIEGRLYWGGTINPATYDPSNDTYTDVGGGGLIYAQDTCFFDAMGVPMAPVHLSTTPSCGGAQVVGVEATVTIYGAWSHVPSYYDVRWYLDNVVVFSESVPADGTANYTYLAAGTGKIGIRARNDFGYTTETNFGGVSQDADGYVYSNNFNVSVP